MVNLTPLKGKIATCSTNSHIFRVSICFTSSFATTTKSKGVVLPLQQNISFTLQKTNNRMHKFIWHVRVHPAYSLAFSCLLINSRKTSFSFQNMKVSLQRSEWKLCWWKHRDFVENPHQTYIFFLHFWNEKKKKKTTSKSCKPSLHNVKQKTNTVTSLSQSSYHTLPEYTTILISEWVRSLTFSTALHTQISSTAIYKPM